MAQAYEEAEATLKPLSRGDRDPYVNYLNGVLAFQQGDLTRAEELLLRVLEIAPEHNPSRLLYGTVNYASKNYGQATYFLSKYVAAVPENSVARKLLARSYILLGKHAESSKVLASAPAGGADDAELMALAAISDMRRGKTAAGIAGLEQAVKLRPESATLRSELAKAYIEMDDDEGARSILEEVLEEGNAGQKSEAQALIDKLSG